MQTLARRYKYRRAIRRLSHLENLENRYKEALKLFHSQDEEQKENGSKQLHNLADNRNHAESQNTLGWHYKHSEDEEERRKAFTYFYKASKQGFVRAWYSLQDCFFYGIGTAEDITAAKSIFRVREETGDLRKSWRPLSFLTGPEKIEYLKNQEEGWAQLELDRMKQYGY